MCVVTIVLSFRNLQNQQLCARCWVCLSVRRCTRLEEDFFFQTFKISLKLFLIFPRYVIHLAIADTLFLFTIILRLSFGSTDRWPGSTSSCIANHTLLYVNYYASVLFLMVRSDCGLGVQRAAVAGSVIFRFSVI